MGLEAGQRLELTLVKEGVRVWVGDVLKTWPWMDRRAAVEVSVDGEMRIVVRNEDGSAPDVFTFEPGVEVSFKVVGE